MPFQLKDAFERVSDKVNQHHQVLINSQYRKLRNALYCPEYRQRHKHVRIVLGPIVGEVSVLVVL